MNQQDLKHKIEEFIEQEARSCSMDFGCVTPEYIYRMWAGRVPQDDIRSSWPDESFFGR